jgi:hypothetical protein
VLFLEQARVHEEIHANSNLAINRIDFDKNVVFGSFVISKCETSQLNLLVLPLPGQNSLIVSETVTQEDHVRPQVALNFADY